MTEIRFYHLQRTQLAQALPGILAQAHKRGMRAVVRLGSKEMVKAMDEALWTYKADSFLPHGAAGQAEDQPIWLTTKVENPNQAKLLILADGAPMTDIEDFDLCCTLFDGNDPDALHAAREDWKTLKESQQAVLKYFQQDDQGRWQEKASSQPNT